MNNYTHPLAKFKFCPICGSPSFAINNEKSKKCGDCGFTYYFNPSSATVAVIIDKNRNILTCRRAKNPAIGTLDLPGGFCDCHETAEDGVIREVKEETGLDVKPVKFLFSLPNTYPYSGFEVQTIDMFFLCTVDDVTSATAADDAAELLLLPIKDILPSYFGLTSIREGIVRIKAMEASGLL